MAHQDLNDVEGPVEHADGEALSPDGDDERTMTRRDVLAIGAGAVATLAAAGCADPPAPTPAPTPPPTTPGLPPGLVPGPRGLDLFPVDPELLGKLAPGAGFEEEAVLEGLGVDARPPLPANLDVSMVGGDITFLNDEKQFMTRPVAVRAYNGEFPGPTGYYNAGDAIELTLDNKLPPDRHPSRDLDGNVVPRAPWKDWSDHKLMDNNVPHGFNVTNLHTHGLHVSPGTNRDVTPPESSDDVHVVNKPVGYPDATPEQQQPRKYKIQLPEFHAPGTHWYHAHVHGSTALQVANGLAGGLIINEPEDEALKTTTGEIIPDAVFLLQEIMGDGLDYRLYGNMGIEGDDGVPLYGGNPAAGIKFTVNGKGNKRYSMPANEFRRFRLINGTGTPRGFMGLEVRDSSNVLQPFYVVANDGITMYGKPLTSQTEVAMLPPGGRVDILLQLSTTGDYILRKLSRNIGGAGPTADEDLMQIRVIAGGASPQELPPSLPARPDKYCYLKPITETPTVQRTMTFAVGPNGPAWFGDFKIGMEPPDAPGAAPRPYGNPSGGPHPEVVVNLNTVEEWTLTNTSNASHPFHIHVNPFQVVEDGKDPSEWVWHDVIRVPQNGSVKIRHRFLSYPGSFVIHCHVLAHEDAGMMWDVKVEDDGTGTGPGQPLATCHCPVCLGDGY